MGKSHSATLRLNGLFQKKSKYLSTGAGVEDMEFPGVLKKEHVEIPGVNYKRSGISRQGCSRKTHVEFPSMGLGFWPWNFQVVSNNFASFPAGVKLVFSPEFLTV